MVFGPVGRVSLSLVGALTAILIAASPAAAQLNPATPSSVGVAGKLSTLGGGVDVAVPVADRVNVRGGFNMFTFNRDFDDDGITFAASLKLRSVTASVDWFAFGGGFHISPGVMLYNGNEVGIQSFVPPGDTFELGDATLFSSATNPVTGTGTVLFNKVAPMVTVGWGNIVPRGERRWSIPFEIGVVYSRAPQATIDFAGTACLQNGTNCRNVATDPTLQADVAREEVKINDALAVLKVLPVMSLGFSYKF
jgi:hypothetical protein